MGIATLRHLFCVKNSHLNTTSSEQPFSTTIIFLLVYPGRWGGILVASLYLCGISFVSKYEAPHMKTIVSIV